jgi:hypothetical protein
VLEVWGHRCTVESHWRLAVNPQPAPVPEEQGQPQVDWSMDRLPGGSVFVSPLAQFSMSPESRRALGPQLLAQGGEVVLLCPLRR